MTSPKPLNSKHGRCNQVFLLRYIDGSKSSDLIKTGRCLSFYQSVLFFHSTDWVYLSIYPSISLSIYPVISFIIYFNIDSLTTQGTWRHFCCHLKIKNINFPRRFWTLDCLDNSNYLDVVYTEEYSMESISIRYGKWKEQNWRIVPKVTHFLLAAFHQPWFKWVSLFPFYLH